MRPLHCGSSVSQRTLSPAFVFRQVSATRLSKGRRKLVTMRKLLTTALFAFASSVSFGWNGNGHVAIARAAYLNLNPKAKAAVDRILSSHPGTSKGSDMFHDFGYAATWPDVVRGSKEDRPTWHYIDLPFDLQGQKGPQPNSTNAVSMLAKNVELLTKGDDASKAVALSWVEHLVGDIHQPLHCTSLFSNEHLPPDGDRGGNGFVFKGPGGGVRKLHSYWDQALELSGTKDPDEIAKAIEAVTVPLPAEAPTEPTFMRWAEEGFKIAQESVYRFRGTMLTENAELPSGYRENTYSVALKRANWAASRLAEILNATLGR